MARKVTVDDTPAQVHWIVQQGDNWSKSLTFTSGGSAMNLAGYTWTAVARDEKYATSTLIATFTVGTGSAASGIITVTLDDSLTSAISAGRYWWELEWVDGSTNRRTVINGPLEVRAQVAAA